jgi:molybdenum cofactor cytidylyltransferase
MGTSKQLLRLGNKAVIRHGVDTLAAAGIGRIIVVCGAEHDACARELTGTSARIVRNEAKDSQMADSVRIGLRALDETCSGVFVCLADHPLVSCGTYQAIIAAHEQSPERIIIPAFEGKRGHPSLFPFSVISDIFFLPSLRDLIRDEGDRVLVVDVPDEGVVLDMDTKEEYRAVVDRFAARADNVPAGERHVHRA